MRRIGQLALVVLGLSGCVTLGRDFTTTDLAWLKPGETAKAAVLEKLGNPFRVGVDAGDPTWTYGYYRWNAFSDSQTKDLVIRWAPDGRVKTFTLNTSLPEEKSALEPSLKKAE